MHCALLFIFNPSTASDVPPNDSLNWEDFQTAHLHAPLPELGELVGRQALLDGRRKGEGDEVSAEARDHGLQILKPPCRERCEKGAFLRYALSLQSYD